MKKILFFLIAFFSLFFIFSGAVKAAEEIDVPDNCDWTVTDKNGKRAPFIKEPISTAQTKIIWRVGNLTYGRQYKVDYKCLSGACLSTFTKTADIKGEISGSTSFVETNMRNDIFLNVNEIGSAVNPRCGYKIVPADWQSEPSPTPRYDAKCTLNVVNPSPIDASKDILLKGTITNVTGFSNYNLACVTCNGSIIGPPPAPKSFHDPDFVLDNSNKTFTLNIGRNWPDDNKNYTVTAKVRVAAAPIPYWAIDVSCSVNFNIPDGVIPTPTIPTICSACGPGKIPCQDSQCNSCPVCAGIVTPIPYPSLAPLCDQLPGEFQVDCKDCVEGQHKIWTAIGCIAPDLGSFISEQLLGVGVGIAGGIAFLYFLYGTFLFLTSRGNPEQIAMGREIIMSSLLGLALIIFSVFLLRVIAVDILDLKPFDFK